MTTRSNRIAKLFSFALALAVLSLGAGLRAQDPPPPPPPGGGEHRMPEPKNLKVLTSLPPGALIPIMRSFTAGLGVKCDFCHVKGDFAADDKHEKEIARHMITMAHDINGRFPDGKIHVTCYTCHRGEVEPKTAPPPSAQ
jgi:hypothetical protein